MSKKKKKATKKPPVHYLTHPLDAFWGRTVCSKSGGATRKRGLVTCRFCIKHVEWNHRRYVASCSRPILLS